MEQSTLFRYWDRCHLAVQLLRDPDTWVMWWVWCYAVALFLPVPFAWVEDAFLIADSPLGRRVMRLALWLGLPDPETVCEPGREH